MNDDTEISHRNQLCNISDDFKETGMMFSKLKERIGLLVVLK